MRVLFVTKDMGSGGAERFVANVFPELSRLGIELRLVLVLDDETMIAPVRDSGIPVTKLGHPYNGLYGPGNIKTSVRKLRSVMEEFRPDILHTQIYLSDLVGYLAAEKGTRILTTIQNTYAWWRWWREKGRKFRYWAMTRVESYLYRSREARFASVSHAVREDAIKFLGLRPERVRTIYNCIRLGDFPLKDLSGRTGGPTIIQVANLHPSKGHTTSLKAFRRVLDEYPDARYLIVGEGRERPRLENMIRELGLEGRAELLGSRRDVKELLLSADVYWMPSLFEGLGIAALEASATGLPCVVSAASGLSEAVADGETGYHVPIGDHEALAGRTLEILGDEELALRLGRAGRERVERQFSEQVIANQYAEAYSDLLDGRW